MKGRCLVVRVKGQRWEPYEPIVPVPLSLPLLDPPIYPGLYLSQRKKTHCCVGHTPSKYDC